MIVFGDCIILLAITSVGSNVIIVAIMAVLSDFEGQDVPIVHLPITGFQPFSVLTDLIVLYLFVYSDCIFLLAIPSVESYVIIVAIMALLGD